MTVTLRRYALVPLAWMVCLPGVAAAQQSTPSFAALAVKPGQIVIVENHARQKVTGKVVAVSDDALEVIANTSGERLRVTPAATREIKRKGHLWDGAVKGAAIGGGIAGAVAYNATYTDRGAIAGSAALMGAPLGSGIGVGVDALFGPKRVFRASESPKVSVSPIVGRTKGANLALRF